MVRTLRIGASSLSFSPDGRILATDGEVIELWRVSDGYLLRTLKDKNVRNNSPITFSPDGQFIAAGGGFVEEIKPDIWTYVGGGIKVWRVKDGLLIKTLMDPTKPVRSVAFSLDGEFLASGHDDGTIRIWEFPEGNLAHVLTGHKDDVSSVAFSPDGEILASGGRDGTIKLWWILEGKTKTLLTSGSKVNLETLLTHGIGVYLLGLLDPIPLDVESIAFSPNGKLLASEGRDGGLGTLADA